MRPVNIWPLLRATCRCDEVQCVLNRKGECSISSICVNLITNVCKGSKLSILSSLRSVAFKHDCTVNRALKGFFTKVLRGSSKKLSPVVREDDILVVTNNITGRVQCYLINESNDAVCVLGDCSNLLEVFSVSSLLTEDTTWLLLSGKEEKKKRRS